MKNRRKSFSKNQHSYAVAQPGVARERSTIDMPSRTITAMDADYLYPCYLSEVLPGDTHQVQGNGLVWLSTPLRPFLDNLYFDTFYFFVPNRLVWENWAKFQGEKENPGDSTTYVVPQIEIDGGATAGAGKLADYFGLPTIAVDFEVNAMPFRGVNLIFNEFFRDQNLQDSLVVDRGDANSLEADYVLMKRGKRKDYITGCLPWPQRGDIEPLVVGGTVPLTIVGDGQPSWDVGDNSSTALKSKTGTDEVTWDSSVTGTDAAIWDEPALTGTANLDLAEGSTINEFRQAVAIQQLLELDARGGTRHVEQIKARFGVTSPDHRHMRPEYLGGGSLNISVIPVAASSDASSRNLGDVGATGRGNGPIGGFTHSFTEHGFVIGLCSLRSDLSYSEGINRMWSRTTRYDYFEPSLAHLGEQPVYNKEVFVSNDSNDDLVWGFAERFSEYKYGNSLITSIMRASHGDSMDFWHLSEEFGSLPTLNDTFIQGNSPLDRVIAVPGEPHIMADMFFTNKCTRVMPVFNTPGLTRL